MRIFSLKFSDLIGVLSSALCMIHCLATPFFFIAATCSVSCCSQTTPLWWQWIDYIFLLISFIAVRQTATLTNLKLIKYGLWISWTFLFVFILNEKFLWFTAPQYAKFIPAFSLIGLHIYNLMYIKCSKPNCC